MKKISFLLLFFLLATIYGDSPPQIPENCTFYGEAYIDNSPATNGTIIEAYIDSIKFAEVIMDRDLLYTIAVPADDPAIIEKEGGIDGDIVKFFIQNNFAGFGEFEKGGIKQLNLHSSSQLRIIQPQEGENLSTLPIFLEWYGGNPPYNLVVSKYQDLRDPVIQKWNLAYNYYNIYQLDKGTYYWKISDARNDFDESYFTYLSNSNPSAKIIIDIVLQDDKYNLTLSTSTTPMYIKAYLYTDIKEEIELTRIGNREYSGSFKADGGVVEALYEDNYGNYCRDFKIIGFGTKYQELRKRAKKNGFDNVYSYVEFLEEEINKNSVELFEYNKAKEKFNEGETLLTFIERLENEANKDDEIKTLNDQITKLKKDKENLQDRIDKLEEDKQNIEKELSQKDEAITKLNGDKSSLKQQISVLKNSLHIKNLISIGAMIFGVICLITVVLILLKNKDVKKVQTKNKTRILSKKEILERLQKHDHVPVKEKNTDGIEKNNIRGDKKMGIFSKPNRSNIDISLEITPQIVRVGQKANLKVYITNFSLVETTFDLVVDHEELEFEGTHAYTTEVKMRSAETINIEIEVATNKARPGKKMIYVSAISDENCLANRAIELYIRNIPEARW